MTWQEELPGFPASAMPEMPDGFADRSWRNDACPSFIHDASGTLIWVDWPYADLRSWDGGRFLVERCLEKHDEAGWQIAEAELLFETDNWQVVLYSLPNFMEAS